MRHFLVALMGCLMIAGCSDPITDFVDKRFPPVSQEQQRAAATQAAAQALLQIHTASAGMALAFDDINAVPLPDDLKKQGIESVAFSGARQLLRVDVAFDHSFGRQDAGTDEQLATLLDTLRLRVRGKITVFAGMTSAFIDKPDGSVLQMKLLPSVSTIDVDRIEVDGDIDLTRAGEAIVGVLNKYKDNISGELSRSPMTSMTLPLVSKAPVDIGQTVKVDSGAVQGTITTTGKPVTAPYLLEGIAWLIAEDGITVLIQLIPVNAPPHGDSPAVAHTFETIEEAFGQHVMKDFGLEDAEGTWLAIRKDVTALAVNSVAAQAALCVAPAINVAKQHAEKQIELPSGLGIDCSPTKVCSQRQCSFDKHADDTRDCNQCAAHAPRVCVGRSFLGPGGCTGGHCIRHWNEPTCEAAKALQNQIYLADANLRKADCDRLAAQEKFACEAEKAGIKALCEVKKEALNALARTGKFANLDVDVSVQTKEMKICLKDFSLSSGLDRLQFELDVTGAAQATVNVEFVPLDIVGHLTCVMDWSKEQTFEATLREARIGIASDVSLTSQPDGFFANAAVKDINVKAKLSPGPTEFLLNSPDLLLKCPVLAAVAPTVLTLTPFIPELKGDIDYKVAEQKLSVKLAVPEQRIADRTLQVTLGSTPAALLARAAFKAQ